MQAYTFTQYIHSHTHLCMPTIPPHTQAIIKMCNSRLCNLNHLLIMKLCEFPSFLTCSLISTHTRTRTHTHARTHARTHTCTHARTHTHTHTHTHKHKHTHIHTHTPVFEIVYKFLHLNFWNFNINVV